MKTYKIFRKKTTLSTIGYIILLIMATGLFIFNIVNGLIMMALSNLVIAMFSAIYLQQTYAYEYALPNPDLKIKQLYMMGNNEYFVASSEEEAQLYTVLEKNGKVYSFVANVETYT